VPRKEALLELAGRLQGEEATAAADALWRLALRGRSLRAIERKLAAALEHPDPEVRRTCTRTLGLWAVGRYSALKRVARVLREALSGGDARRRARVEEALCRVAPSWRNFPALHHGLEPLLEDLLRDPDPEVRSDVLRHLLARARLSFDPAFLLPPVFDLAVDGEPVERNRARALVDISLRHGTDVAVLGRRIAHEVDQPELSASTARILTRLAIVTGDGALLARVLGHPSHGARQCCAEHLSWSIRFGGSDLGFAVEALGRALEDEGDGVVWAAAEALVAASAAGADLGAALEPLTRMLARDRYGSDNWHGMWFRDELPDDLSDRSPARDAATALTRHYLRYGSDADVRVLWAGGGPRVREGVVRGLKAPGPCPPVVGERARCLRNEVEG